MFLIFFAKIHPFSETSKISADFLFAIRVIGTDTEVNLSPMIPDPNSHPRHYLFPLFVNIIWLY